MLSILVAGLSLWGPYIKNLIQIEHQFVSICKLVLKILAPNTSERFR